MTITFADADLTDSLYPPDNAPELSDVEYPCEVCGRESGPYGGRGRKPKRCPEHKRNPVKAAKVTGSNANLASQATAVLVQMNGLIAMGAMAVGMFGTASAMAKANDSFEVQAHAALVTDPDLCRLILKTGQTSAKFSLGLAYVGLGIAVGPVAVMEMKEKRQARAERKAAEQDA